MLPPGGRNLDEPKPPLDHAPLLSPTDIDVGRRAAGAAAETPVHRRGAAFDPSAAMDSSLDPLHGQRVDHYRVLRVLGQGGMGRVLLARDTRLGRLVALKVIRPDRVDVDRVLALLDEARLTARLSHPHVVAIYHVGRIGPSPYLALEYVEGASLRQRLREGAIGERELLRVGAAIASALAAAHAEGVLHRDLKPENIMLGHDGRPRVVDFGIAAVLETQTNGQRRPAEGEVIGTPGYMAPEQWVGRGLSPAVDVWALGVILYEALAGHRPWEGPTADSRPLQVRVSDAAAAPPPLHVELRGLPELVEKMLALEPTERPPAASVQRELEGLLAQPTTAARGAGGPFRGLQSFEEHDAAWFFGREAEIAAMVETLRTYTVVPVVGPSGVGKSSLVRAGVLPRLREQADWTVLTVRPGAHPLMALAARLVSQETTGRRSLAHTSGRDAARVLAAELLLQPHAANLELHLIAEARATRVLLLVDQLEEVVTHASDPAERAAFLDAVAGAADPVDEQVRVIVTVRDDFLGRVAVGEPMRRALRHVVVPRSLDGPALRDAIVLPLARAGGAFDDPTLADAMVAQVLGEPAALPLLQFACTALWERRDREHNRLRRADYEAIGGVVGALGRNAEAVLTGMTSEEVAVARRLLLMLVGPEGARRVAEREAVVRAVGDNADRVIERLLAARLVTSRRALDGHGAHVVLELAHEALVQAWPQLQRWVEESHEERSALAELEAAAQLWQRRGRRHEELWDGDALRDVRRRRHDASAAESEVASDFVRASEAAVAARRRRRALALGGLGAALALVAGASLATAAYLQDQEREQRALAQRLAAKNQEVVAKGREIQSAAAAMALAAADMGAVEVELAFLTGTQRAW